MKPIFYVIKLGLLSIALSSFVFLLFDYDQNFFEGYAMAVLTYLYLNQKGHLEDIIDEKTKTNT